MTNEQQQTAAMYLDLVSAKAKALARDLRNGGTWPGDASRGIAEISQALSGASGQIGADR